MISKRLSPTPFAKAEIYPEIDFWRKSTKKSILERTFSFVLEYQNRLFILACNKTLKSIHGATTRRRPIQERAVTATDDEEQRVRAY